MGNFTEDLQAQLDAMGKAQQSKMQAPEAPTVNPQYQDLLDKQKKIADDYRKNLPEYSKSLGNQYESGARQKLASGLKQTDQDFNRRGLLYSSARVGQEVGQQAQSASDIAAGRQQINRGLLDKANEMDAGVFSTGMGIAGQDTGSYQLQAQSDIMSLKNDIYNNQMQSSMLGSLAGGAGSLVGLGLGNFSYGGSIAPTGGAANGVLAGYYAGLK